MYMIDINLIEKFYRERNFNTDEITYLQIVQRLKNWQSKSDVQKQEYRKSYLKMSLTHFSDEKNIDYIKQVILVTDLFLIFLNMKQYDIKLSELSEDEELFFRLYNLVYCEKEILLMSESIEQIRTHIPYSIFSPLLSKLENTVLHKKFELEQIFIHYQKLLELSRPPLL